MIVCVCNNVSDKVVEKITTENDIESIRQLQNHLPVCNQCKRCGSSIQCIIKSAMLNKDKIAA
jgi:bacterioferritin-associated ferredoxin